MGTPQKPIEITPVRGILGIAGRLAQRAGLGDLWSGPDGLEAIAREKLAEWGVPESVPVSNPKAARAVTPRDVAEAAGFIRPRRRQRRAG